MKFLKNILGITALENKIMELEGELESFDETYGELTKTVEELEDRIYDLETEFRNFPDAEDIPDHDDIINEVEKMIEKSEDSIEEYKQEIVDQIESIEDPDSHNETKELAIRLGIVEESDF